MTESEISGDTDVTLLDLIEDIKRYLTTRLN